MPAGYPHMQNPAIVAGVKKYVAEGCSIGEIALKLKISHSSVKPMLIELKLKTIAQLRYRQPGNVQKRVNPDGRRSTRAKPSRDIIRGCGRAWEPPVRYASVWDYAQAIGSKA